MRSLKSPLSPSISTKLYQRKAGDGCVLWLPGQDDAKSSTVKDKSGNNNHGTITNATWARLSRGLWGIDHNGTNAQISCGTGASLNITGNIYISIWINPDAVAGNPIILSKGDLSVGDGTTYALQIVEATSLLRFAIKDYGTDGVGYRDSTSTITTGKWQKIGIMFNPTSDALQFLINGKVDRDTTLTGAPPSKATEALYIGCRYNGGLQNYYNGKECLLSIKTTIPSVATDTNDYNHTRSLFDV